jgi:hypothetical protein
MGINNLRDVAGQEDGPKPPFRGFIRSASGASALNLPVILFAWNIQASTILDKPLANSPAATERQSDISPLRKR